MPGLLRQTQQIRLRLLQVLQPIAQIRAQSESDFHGCAPVVESRGLITMTRPMIIQTEFDCWQISSSSRAEVMFFRRTVMWATDCDDVDGVPCVADCVGSMVGEMTNSNPKRRPRYNRLASAQAFIASPTVTFSKSTSEITVSFKV